MKAKLIDVGKRKVNEIVEVANRKELNKKIDEYVHSQSWVIEPSKDPNVFDISAGFKYNGTVKILEQ